MNIFKINPNDLSNIFWNKVFTLTSPYVSQKLEFFKFINSLEANKKKAEYNTGSISGSTAWALYSLSYYFQPKSFVEIGTFIGKSLFSMMLGSRAGSCSNEKLIAYSCDNKNNITLPKKNNLIIKQFNKKISTEMFKSISKNSKIDLFHFDGRIIPEDINYIKNFSTEKTIYIFDDFETIEKGIVNFSLLVENNLIDRKKFCLIKPPEEIILNKFDLYERCNTALVIPYSLVNFSNQ